MPRLLVLVVGLAVLGLAGAGPIRGQEVGDFTARDALSGQEFSLHDLRGRVVVIDFWATWCGPCVRELPNVKRAYSRYKAQGLEIVSVSLDSDRKRFESFVRQPGMTWHHVLEGGGWGTRLAQQFGVNSIPRMIVVDPKGVCIADGVRGRSLDQAIEAGLAKVKRSERPATQPVPESADEPPAFQAELEAMHEQLGELAT